MEFSIDRNTVKDNDIIIKLKIDANITEGWYMQSSNPDLSPSAPAEILINDSQPPWNQNGTTLEGQKRSARHGGL